MLARKPKTPATYADLEALPANMVGEILYGVLHAHPRPAPGHARASSRLGAELDGPFDRGRGGPGGWIILDEPELHLGPHVVVPDIAGWRRERLTPFPEHVGRNSEAYSADFPRTHPFAGGLRRFAPNRPLLAHECPRA
jgi:hypothetical protein